MDNLEKYIHKEDKLDILVQLSFVHAQFELLHPFLDGNGRIGRMLIPLFLYGKQIISSPSFYMSAYLEAHREEYYARLRALSESDAFQVWVEFFSNAMVAQAHVDSAKIREIMALCEKMKSQIADATQSTYAIQALDALFARLIFSVVQFEEAIGASRTTARRLLTRLTEVDVLRQTRPGSGPQPSTYQFPALISIVQM